MLTEDEVGEFLRKATLHSPAASISVDTVARASRVASARRRKVRAVAGSAAVALLVAGVGTTRWALHPRTGARTTPSAPVAASTTPASATSESVTSGSNVMRPACAPPGYDLHGGTSGPQGVVVAHARGLPGDLQVSVSDSTSSRTLSIVVVLAKPAALGGLEHPESLGDDPDLQAATSVTSATSAPLAHEVTLRYPALRPGRYPVLVYVKAAASPTCDTPPPATAALTVDVYGQAGFLNIT